ncbi:Sodium channel protein 60E [Diplonema papillatum]|nr:Sodium channel protein 60E [Diplonema papillatum]
MQGEKKRFSVFVEDPDSEDGEEEHEVKSSYEKDLVALRYSSCYAFRPALDEDGEPLPRSLRRLVFNLTHHRVFEGVVVFLIFANCVTLALDDPVQANHEKPDYTHHLEYLFTACFALELVLKVYSQGFVLHQGSYLRSGWNRLDFMIVTFSFLAFIPSFGNYTAIRTFRVLRPLRSISGIHGLRKIVNGLLHSMRKLVNVLMLAGLLFSIFSILGVQLWAGLMRYRCQWVDPATVCIEDAGDCCVPVNSSLPACCFQMPPGTESCSEFPGNSCGCRVSGEVYVSMVQQDVFCSPSAINGGFMGEAFGRSCGAGYECVDSGVNPDFGYTNFDNVGSALLVVFQCLTLEGWTDIMYIIQDVSSDFGVIYFILLILLGSYFILNLALAVINEEFDKIKRWEDEQQELKLLRMQQEQERLMLELLRLHSLDPPPAIAVEDAGEGSTSSSSSDSTDDGVPRESAQKVFNTSSDSDLGDCARVAPGDDAPRISVTRLDNFELSKSDCSHRTSPASDTTEPTLAPHAAVKSGGDRQRDDPARLKCISQSRSPSARPEPLDAQLFAARFKHGAAAQADGQTNGKTPINPLSRDAANDAPASGGKVTLADTPQHQSVGLDLELATAETETQPQGNTPSWRTLWKRLRWFCWRLVAHKVFTLVIIFFIVVNTLLLSAEHHDQPAALSSVLEIANYVLTAIFAVEMLLKLLASGFRGYVKDRFNVLDGSIVVVSVLELFLLANTSVSVFRALRLLRVFKLLKNFHQLRSLVQVILNAVSDTGYLNLIILLYIFCAALLGMQFFGGSFHFPENCPADNPTCPASQPRAHFDSFYASFLTVFQILTRDDWNTVMWDAMRSTHPSSTLYFLTLVICGDFIVLNLFLAILIQSFDRYMQSDRGDADDETEDGSIDDVPPPEPDIAPRPVTMQQLRLSLGQLFPDTALTSELSNSARDRTADVLQSSHLRQSRASRGSRASVVSVDRKRGSITIAAQKITTGYHEGQYVRTEAVRVGAAFKCRSEIVDSRGKKQTTNFAQHAMVAMRQRSLISAPSDRRLLAHQPSLDHHISFQPGEPSQSALPSTCLDRPALANFSPKQSLVNNLAVPIPTRNSSIATTESDLISVHHVSSCNSSPGGQHAFANYDPQSFSHYLANNSHRRTLESRPDEFDVCHRCGEERHARGPASDSRRLATHARMCGTIETRKAKVRAWMTVISNIVVHQHQEWSLALVTAIVDEAQKAGFWLDKTAADFEDMVRPVKVTVSAFGCEMITEKCRVVSRPNGIMNALKPGEEILTIDGVPMRSDIDILRCIAAARPEQPLVVGVRLHRHWSGIRHEAERQMQAVRLHVGEEVMGGCVSASAQAALPVPWRTNGGRSLFIFGSESRVRLFVCFMVRHPLFEKIILVFILSSSMIMIAENPRQAATGSWASFLEISNYVFTGIFTLEMVMKIVAFGLIFDEGDSEPAYLKEKWNILDGSIVVLAILSLSLNSYDFSELKVLRTFRALRPLRVISRNRGLRMVVSALLRSISSIGNVAIVTLIVFLVFGILGVQLFAGKMYFCTDASVSTRAACTGQYADGDTGLLKDRSWRTGTFSNFDNVGQAILTLFEVATLELWTTIMYRCIDAVSPDEVPRRDHNPAVGIFFIVFVIVGSFFVLNLFVGFVIFNFAKVKGEEDGTAGVGVTDEQKLWMETQTMMLNFRPIIKMPVPPQPWRRRLHRVCQSANLEILIGICIILNIGVMGMEYHGMSQAASTGFEVVNHIFSFIFATEAIAKLVAFGSSYFKDPWNRFDGGLVVLSALQIILVLIVSTALPIKGYILRACRIFRVLRILRLVRSAKDVRILLETIWYSLPHIANIGAFGCLLFLIYAVLGVNLFAKVKRGTYLNRHANFESFPAALLLLVRIVTGENWNGIMHETMVREPDCDSNLDNCGTLFAPLYYLSFLLVANFILTNLFVAIILDNFRTTILIEKSDLRMTDLHRFIETWATFDPDATLRIPTSKFPALLESLGPPLGIKKRDSRLDVLNRTKLYCIPEHGGVIHFIETLIPLARQVLLAQDQVDYTDLRDQEEKWRSAFPDINDLPLLRFRQRRITVDQYFSSTYIAAAYRRSCACRRYRRELLPAFLRRRYGWQAAERPGDLRFARNSIVLSAAPRLSPLDVGQCRRTSKHESGGIDSPASDERATNVTPLAFIDGPRYNQHGSADRTSSLAVENVDEDMD